MITHFIIFILSCLVIVAGATIQKMKKTHAKELMAQRASEDRIVDDLRQQIQLVEIQELMTRHTAQVDLENLELDYLLLADKYHNEKCSEACCD